MGSRNFLLTIDAIQLAKTTACSFSRGMDNHFKGATLDLEKKKIHIDLVPFLHSDVADSPKSHR
jgi:hypothetical protein